MFRTSCGELHTTVHKLVGVPHNFVRQHYFLLVIFESSFSYSLLSHELPVRLGSLLIRELSKLNNIKLCQSQGLDKLPLNLEENINPTRESDYIPNTLYFLFLLTVPLAIWKIKCQFCNTGSASFVIFGWNISLISCWVATVIWQVFLKMYLSDIGNII